MTSDLGFANQWRLGTWIQVHPLLKQRPVSLASVGKANQMTLCESASEDYIRPLRLHVLQGTFWFVMKKWYLEIYVNSIASQTELAVWYALLKPSEQELLGIVWGVKAILSTDISDTLVQIKEGISHNQTHFLWAQRSSLPSLEDLITSKFYRIHEVHEDVLSFYCFLTQCIVGLHRCHATASSAHKIFVIKLIQLDDRCLRDIWRWEIVIIVNLQECFSLCNSWSVVWTEKLSLDMKWQTCWAACENMSEPDELDPASHIPNAWSGVDAPNDVFISTLAPLPESIPKMTAKGGLGLG